MLREGQADPPGLNPKLHHVRATSVRLPRDAVWVEAVQDRVNIAS